MFRLWGCHVRDSADITGDDWFSNSAEMRALAAGKTSFSVVLGRRPNLLTPRAPSALQSTTASNVFLESCVEFGGS